MGLSLPATVMVGSLIPVTLGLLLTAPDTLLAPRDIVRETIRAVESDSAAILASRWQSRVTPDSSDRVALFGLATLARFQYDYPTAERLYRRLLRGDVAPADRLAVYARLGLAQGLDAQGFGTRAAEELAAARAAAHAAGDSAAEGEALLGLSLQRAFSAGIEAGLATLDTVERLVPPQHYDLHTERLRQRGALRGIVGSPGAREDAAAALGLARRARSHRLVGQALRSTAQLLQFEGKRDSSITVLQQAEAAYDQGHDRSQLATALLWHVNALLAQGDLGEANDLANRALTEGQAAGNGFAVGAAYTALGSIAIFLNDYPVASGHLQKSINLFERLGDPAGAMKARDYLAVTALAAGDLAGARRQTLEALQWYRRTHEALIEFGAHRNLAIIAMHEHDWAAADRSLQDARTLARRMNRPIWSRDLTYDEGRLALFRGDLNSAARHFTRYLTTLDSSQHVFRHDARVRLADVYAQQGDLARAEREARAAWDELEHWRATLTDSELRVLAFQASPTEMSDRDASVVRVLAALAHGGRMAESFELAERRRARELTERLAQARALSPREKESRPAPAPVVATPVAAVEVGNAIPDDSTAILEYVTGSLGAPTTLFVLTRGSSGRPLLQTYRLAPVDSLEDQIARFEALLQGGGQVGELARSLGDSLLAPGVRGLDPRIHRLIIVPDGPLHRLTFDALQLTTGSYAIGRFAISLAPSAGILTALWERNRKAQPEDRPVRLLAFGDPAFAKRSPRLRNSAREARLVADYSPASVVRLREEASAAYLKRADLTPFRVLHFATHSLVDEHTAARTALVLAPGNGDDGLVGPDELAGLRLDADLVVFSSCRSGGGVVVNGEGIQGLTAPVVQAGARAVVATQWEVGDQATVKFVDALYRHMAQGLPVGEALRSAKLNAMERGDPPRVWAAFIAVGDPLVRIPLQMRQSRVWFWPIFPVLALVMAALAAGYSRRVRRRRNGEAA